MHGIFVGPYWYRIGSVRRFFDFLRGAFEAEYKVVTFIFTCGDPLSINIEGFLRAVVPSLSRHRAILGVGSYWQLRHQSESLGLKLPDLQVVQTVDQARSPGVFWLDPLPQAPKLDARDMSEIDRGKLARASLEAVPSHSERPLAVLTAPINKKAAASAGFLQSGQTEFFEQRWGAQAVMMLAGPQLRVALATNHVALRDVADRITTDMLVQKIKIVHSGMEQLFGLKRPKIAVCGLNPHCGDGGLFGLEDLNIVVPAVQIAAKTNIDVVGPVSADTVFYRAMQGEFDVVVAMYHDQGLGPLKTVHFDEAVNISLGLPHLRVSPDHGPAADLYLSGRASMRSFDAALKVCERWLGGEHGA